MIVKYSQYFTAFIALALIACENKTVSETKKSPSALPDSALLRVGDYSVLSSDLDHYLDERHEGRKDAATQKIALAELAERAQFSQAAKDAGLEHDPIVRAEFSRILASRYKEKFLQTQIKEIAQQEIPESRLREIYQQDAARFTAPEKRQVAVLWLNPNRNPERLAQYRDKLSTARDWLLNNPSVKDDPSQGFSVLSVDHSEHAPSRYKGGVIGWLEASGGFDPFTKAVATIAFSIEQEGALSQVVERSEGVFLVRLMKIQPSNHRSFESVKKHIVDSELQRLRNLAEKNFKESIAQKHPVTWSQASPETKP